MKEIDFLPEWYKSGRRRQINYRAQYIALGGVFVVMMVWNFVAAHSVSRATAELANLKSNASLVESALQESAAVKSQMARFEEKAGILEKIDSRIDVASVLAELSFLVDERIVFSKVEFVAERFADKQENKAGSGSIVRVVRANFGKKGESLGGDVRFKVVIGGVAADASDVAKLVCKLEDSPYFCQVIPSWRKGEIKAVAKAAGKSYPVSEFEISGYLANYEEVIRD